MLSLIRGISPDSMALDHLFKQGLTGPVTSQGASKSKASPDIRRISNRRAAFGCSSAADAVVQQGAGGHSPERCQVLARHFFRGGSRSARQARSQKGALFRGAPPAMMIQTPVAAVEPVPGTRPALLSDEDVDIPVDD